MDKQRLSRRNMFFIGSMLFGMFFGAGNLIFPVFLGQQAGRNLVPAIIGFLISGVGLPLLGVAAIGKSHTDGAFGVASKLGKGAAYVFTVILYLGLGPLFATPRLATISYEIGLRPFVPGKYEHLALALFSFLFFATAWYFSRKPGKIMTYVGKILTPAFMVTLILLLLFVVLFPLGGWHAPATGMYKSAAVVTGFTNGYMTMDALASLAFGVVVVRSIRELGVTDTNAVAKDTMRAGLIAAVLMAVLYAVLAYMGLTSLGEFDRASNGGIIIANIARYYFGTLGSILTAVIVVLACLKTGVGLITAFGDMFKELFPKMNYQVLILIAAAVPFLLANIGLNSILAVSQPFLYTLYPIAIVLILLTLASDLFHDDHRVYKITVGVTLIPALLDGVNALPMGMHTGFIQQLLDWGGYLPGFAQGLGWTVPAVIAFIVALIYRQLRPVN
ncbi:branched-chain amino acid transport system II carrier protein [Lacticaseibacillus pabuli]|uniref:Branched-chain amino acid transport system carrier protein n=1 Tax=Lacticaseibacillus pabuli TaxID=3025672 RepID=A0ABY7WWZ5_9LACO|nr:branched-chain amino acid transport system II carrier protein [Lacticaseibacillus sp. KACC 23028]WDF82450.1 branched-chain amino acid transport system II carrier protein [Lacticaseibacillus sp. KACC 23028]